MASGRGRDIFFNGIVTDKVAMLVYLFFFFYNILAFKL